jgi:hypothetical protein
MRLLSDSNQQLAAINRWLGQLAREANAMNAMPHTSRDIAVIRLQLDVHLRTVAAMIRANLNRWSR